MLETETENTEKSIIEVLAESLSIARKSAWKDDFYRTEKKQEEEKAN